MIIDFHGHSPATTRTADGRLAAAYTGQEFLGFMDEAGIGVSVMLAHQGFYDRDMEDNNDFLAEFCAADPKRLLPFGTVHPRFRGAVDEIERMVFDLGMRGMKIHPWVQGVSVLDASMTPIANVLEAANAILVSHDGTPPYAMGSQLAALARRHPRLVVVLAHAGLFDFWREAVQVAWETPNIYLCPASSNPFAGGMVVKHGPKDRVLWGTDSGAGPAANRYVIDRIKELEAWGLSEEDIVRVTETNPRRLLAERGAVL